MADPFKELATLVEMRISDRAAKALSGVPCELGTITSTGLKLDKFKYEINDYLIADWQVKVYFPAFFLVGTATSPVDEQGNDLPGASTSNLTRYNFNAKEVDQVRLDFKADLKSGDRVLAVLVNGGKDAVVVAKVVS